MDNTNIVSNSEVETTKEELISRLSKRLAESEGIVAYCKNKIETGGRYLGDVRAELAQAEAEARVSREILYKILN